MKIGCSTLLYHKRGLFKCMDDIARIGYEYVELNCVRGYYGHFNSIQLADSPELLEMIANSLKKNNLKCSGIDCHGLYQEGCEGRRRADGHHKLSAWRRDVGGTRQWNASISSNGSDGRTWLRRRGGGRFRDFEQHDHAEVHRRSR